LAIQGKSGGAGRTLFVGEMRHRHRKSGSNRQRTRSKNYAKERSVTTDKIQFTKEKETMLMTLSGRAIQSQWKNPILRDPWAEEAMRHIDYDLSKQLTGVASWSMWKDIGPTIIASRAATFDMLTNRYLADHPHAVVIQVGCGMDSRVFRVNPPASVEWFDADYPDVIDLRRRLFPKRDAYQQIGAPLEDLRWLDEVPRDKPGLLIAEGVLHYLSEAEVKNLLNAVVAHFPSGQIIFDICNSFIVKRAGSNVGGRGQRISGALMIHRTLSGSSRSLN
jgi:O-methyltransferase involved in polyketide biosynthesis